MPDISGIFVSDPLGAPATRLRASQAWRRIQRKPHNIIVIRGGAAQTAQTVRIEWATGNSAPMAAAESGRASQRVVQIFGIQGHPTEDDTDLQRGDRFRLPGETGIVQYEVKSIDRTQIGEVQAIAEVIE